MTKQEILRTTHAKFEEFRAVWADLVQELGFGALVFVSDDAPGADDEIQCQFWTLGELRHYLRHEPEGNEVMSRLLRAAESGGGYPLSLIHI